MQSGVGMTLSTISLRDDLAFPAGPCCYGRSPPTQPNRHACGRGGPAEFVPIDCPRRWRAVTGRDALMPCRSCGRDTRGGAVFCDGCGAQLTPSCRECGREVRPDAHFCDTCGAQIQVSSVGNQGSETTRTEHPKPNAWHPKPDPRSYTPKHLVDNKTLTLRAALEPCCRRSTNGSRNASGPAI